MNNFEEKCIILHRELMKLKDQRYSGKVSFSINWTEGGITHISLQLNRDLMANNGKKGANNGKLYVLE